MTRRHFTPIAVLFALAAGLTTLGSPAGAAERAQRRQGSDGQGSGQGSQGSEPSSQRQDGDDSWRGRDWRADGRYRNDDRHGQDWNRSRRVAPTYRYSYGGRSYHTDEYGAQFIRNALRHGYEEGVRAARRARASRWGYDPRGCDAYRDGSYGYGGGYGVRFDRGQYSVYFRQGFQRGYDEAYYGRYHYGSYRNGGVHVVVDLLDLILDLRRLH